jgi:hypothetical protein
LYFRLFRFEFSKLIAYKWFEILEKKSPEEVKALKDDMINKNLIGEYCGNQNYQHLIKYEICDIIFYAIVELDSENSCLAPNEALEFFKKHKLSCVECKISKGINSRTVFFQELKKIYEMINTSSIEEQGEGCVLYFVSESSADSSISNQTLSLCKLKTLEYRLFRKLREKLKNCIQFGKKKSENMNQFIKEAEDLCKFYPPAKPFDYYIKIAESAFDTVIKMNKKADKSLFKSKYIDFLDKIKQEVEANSQIAFSGQDLLGEDLAFTQKLERKFSRIIILSPPLYIPPLSKPISSLVDAIESGNLELNSGRLEKNQIKITFETSVDNTIQILAPGMDDTFLWVLGFGKSSFEMILKIREEKLTAKLQETLDDRVIYYTICAMSFA